MSSSINNNNNNVFKTREQLLDAGLFWSKPFSILKEVYVAMHNGCLDNIHIYHSDVYYVRAALEKHTGFLLSLPLVEQAMKDEGWRDRKGYGRFK